MIDQSPMQTEMIATRLRRSANQAMGMPKAA